MQDGNRRLAMQRRCLREATGLAMSDIEAWADHMYSPEGTRLRDVTARDVGNVRRKALFRDGRYWRPSSATPEAIEAWLKASNVAQRTVIRNSVILAPARGRLPQPEGRHRRPVSRHGATAPLHPPDPHQDCRAEGMVGGHPGDASSAGCHAPDHGPRGQHDGLHDASHTW